MEKRHIIILCIVVVIALVIALVVMQPEEATDAPPTGSIVDDNCGGPGQPSCADYCEQNPTAPECIENVQ